MLIFLVAIIALACLPLALVVARSLLAVVLCIVALLVCLAVFSGVVYFLYQLYLEMGRDGWSVDDLILPAVTVAMLVVCYLLVCCTTWLQRITVYLGTLVGLFFVGLIPKLNLYFADVAPVADWQAAVAGLTIGLLLAVIFRNFRLTPSWNY